MLNMYTSRLLRVAYVTMALHCIHFNIQAQGTLRGKVSDENGEALIGVTIILKSDQSIGANSDFDGNYSLTIPDSNPNAVIVSYFGYENLEEAIQVEGGNVVIRDFGLKPSSLQIEEVKIVARQERSKVYYMENIKKRSATTLDYVAAEQMKKIGDNNVTAAIARVSGVSTNGSFITVRGIGDRYVKTGINGALIPTLDPFTNNIKLDLIPSSLVDNITITKTASPDLPGDWSAAYISVETKDYPEKMSLIFETSIGFNEQTSFKNILANQTSSTDWLGYDNGYRNIDHSLFRQVNPNPTRYEELVALGYGNYYKSLGVTESWSSSSSVGDTYFKLGLIEMGLLGKAYIHDEQAVAEAKKAYFEGDYQQKAYMVINDYAAKNGQTLPNNWNLFNKKSPLNFSQTFSFGNQSNIFGIPVGYIAGFRYNSSIEYDPNSTISRTARAELDSFGMAPLESRIDQKIARYTNGWSALFNLSTKLDLNNSLSFLFMPNFTGVNALRDGLDVTLFSSYPLAYTRSQYYEERKLLTYQLKSEHFLPKQKLKLNSAFSFTRGNSSVPDFKNIEYFGGDTTSLVIDKTMSDPRRNYRYLSEEVLDMKVSGEIPLNEKPGTVSKLKIGTSYTNTYKEFLQYDYFLKFNEGATAFIGSNNLETFFNLNKFGINPDLNINKDGIDLYYSRDFDPANNTVGYSRVFSAYALVDQTIFKKLRLSGGARLESSKIFTEVKKFRDQGLPRNDPRRLSGFSQFIVNPTNLNSLDILPSINLIYNFNEDDLFPSTLRLNYSRSLARPSIREYSETIMFDFELNSEVFGNSDLKFVHINNFDLRFEKYFNTGDNVSVSLFYKTFKNHIELLNAGLGFSWANADNSNVYGLEIEGRKKLFKNLEIRSNISLVKSETSLTFQRLEVRNGVKNWIPLEKVKRTMFGQAPFVVNTILNYTNDSIGLSLALSYNIQGPKLVLSSFGEVPDVYEMPRHLFDCKVIKEIGKHYSLNFTVRDVLNASRRRAYKFEEGYLLDFDKFNYGTNYTFSVVYKL